MGRPGSPGLRSAQGGSGVQKRQAKRTASDTRPQASIETGYEIRPQAYGFQSHGILALLEKGCGEYQDEAELSYEFHSSGTLAVL